MKPQPFSDIGSEFCGGGYGTVICGCKTIENMIDQDASIKRSVEYRQKLVANSK
jgi:chromosomal replication initiation ATPase DnaA